MLFVDYFSIILSYNNMILFHYFELNCDPILHKTKFTQLKTVIRFR